MINGRDEMFAIKGVFSEAQVMSLESECSIIEDKLNRKYGPKPDEKVNYFWNPIRVYIQSRTTSSDNISGIRIAIHSSAAVAKEAKDGLTGLGYETSDLI